MINLRISEEQFNELYPDLVGHYAFFDNPPPLGISDEEFVRRYLKNKLWRLNNCYHIINKHGEPTVFRMNYAQHKVYAATRKHPRVIILKSRQQGISTFWLVSFSDDAMFCPFLNVGLMAQGTDEASTLLEKVKFLWDTLDPNIKEVMGLRLTRDNTKEYGFINGSNIFIRVSFRSTTLQRLHVSEMGKIANHYPQRAKEVKTGTLQALARGNTGVIESTAEGKNMFKEMWEDAVIAEESGRRTAKDFKPVFLSWVNDPDCNEEVDQDIDEEAAKYFEELEKNSGIVLTRTQKNFWVTQRRELKGDIFQEYPATPEEAFTASRDGTYYARLFMEHVVRKGGLVSDLYDPNLYTDVYFDLGTDDYTVMCFAQTYRSSRRIVKEYWNNGLAIGYYLKLIKDSGIHIRDIVLPHDANHRTIATQGESKAKNTVQITREWIKENNVDWNVRVLAKSSVESGIQAVRNMIPSLMIDPACTYLIDCLKSYSKEFDVKLQVWKTTPMHDEYSHGADAIRQMAVDTMANRSSERHKIPQRSNANSGYAI